MKAKVGIVVPVLNNFRGLATFLSSIDIEVSLFIQPNWIDNRGVSGGWNDGIKQAFGKECTHVFIANDDIVLGKGTLTNLVKRLHDNSFPVVMATGRNIRGQPGVGKRAIEEFAGEGEGPSPDFSCFMMNKTCWDLVGPFDENFRPAYFEDNDYHYRMKILGLEAMNLANAPIFHLGSATQNHDKDKPIVTGAMFDINRRYYQKKWGGNPGEEKYLSPFNNPKNDASIGFDPTWKML